MIGELRQLLAEAGYPRALAPEAWRRMVVVNNWGSVPLPLDLPPDYAAKGFKILLLDDRGRPTQFARCGAASDGTLRRESRILEQLGRVPELHGFIPAIRTATSEHLHVQISEFVTGLTYDRSVRRETPQSWLHRTLDILALSERVTEAAAVHIPDLARAGPVDPAVEGEPRLAVLARAGIEPHVLDAVGAALRQVGPLRRRLQHGDLWPGNVLRTKRGWCLIDFAEFGQVQVPMYDVFHMVRYSPLWWRNPDYTWYSTAAGDPERPWTDASQQIVRDWGRRAGLTPAQLGGALLYYLVHISAYRLRGGVPRHYGVAFLNELGRVSEQLRRGHDLARLLEFGAGPKAA